MVTEEHDHDDSLESTPDDLAGVVADLRAAYLVDPDELLARRHLSAMAIAAAEVAAAEPAPRRRRRRRVLVPVGVAGGLILATSGLAAAGVLPGPVQRAVAAAARPFGVELQTDSSPIRSDTPGAGGRTADAGSPDTGPPTSTPPVDPSQDAPGHGGTNPGQSEQAPGQQDAPGASGDAPGHGGENPGQSDQAPGQGGANPGQSDQAPGHDPTSTNPSATRPSPPTSHVPPTTLHTPPTSHVPPTTVHTPPTTPAHGK
jgi:hypothetical protein